MKKLTLIIAMSFVAFFSSCNPASTNNERYTFINRKQAILVADTQTGEMYRMTISENGATTWQKLGSPEDAK